RPKPSCRRLTEPHRPHPGRTAYEEARRVRDREVAHRSPAAWNRGEHRRQPRLWGSVIAAVVAGAERISGGPSVGGRGEWGGAPRCGGGGGGGGGAGGGGGGGGAPRARAPPPWGPPPGARPPPPGPSLPRLSPVRPGLRSARTGLETR